MTDDDLEKILVDPWIIRNRLKIYSVRKNAQVALEIQKEQWSLDQYFRNFIHHTPQVHRGENITDFPTEDDISQKIAKDLKKRGMNFVGSTIIYAFMQAVGMVDDHINTCFRKQ